MFSILLSRIFHDSDANLIIGGASSVFWNILAWTIIYGLTFSTVLTLIIVPCLYWINERVRDKWFRKGDTANVPARQEEPAEV